MVISGHDPYFFQVIGLVTKAERLLLDWSMTGLRKEKIRFLEKFIEIGKINSIFFIQYPNFSAKLFLIN